MVRLKARPFASSGTMFDWLPILATPWSRSVPPSRLSRALEIATVAEISAGVAMPRPYNVVRTIDA